MLCSSSTANEKQPTFYIEPVMDYAETHTYTSDPPFHVQPIPQTVFDNPLMLRHYTDYGNA